MTNSKPFQSDSVLEERILGASLKAYHVGFENNKFRLEPLVDVIRSVIPEFAFGFHEGEQLSLAESIEKVRLAAHTIYCTDKYKKRGEFGELILHLLLRDYHQTIPLISKIYFKDSVNVAVHGFDAVHVSIHGDEKKLWLGESKIYESGSIEIKALVGDFIDHFKAD